MIIYTIYKMEGKGMEVIEGEYIINDSKASANVCAVLVKRPVINLCLKDQISSSNNFNYYKMLR